MEIDNCDNTDYKLGENGGNDSGYLSESFSLSPDSSSNELEAEAAEHSEDTTPKFNCFGTSDLIKTAGELLGKLLISTTSTKNGRAAAVDTNGIGNRTEHETFSINVKSKNNAENHPEKELQRKKSPRNKESPRQSDDENKYDEETTAAIDALFHVLLFHDSCDLFCKKAEETWFWDKSVNSIRFMTAKSWFKELLFYFRKFRMHLRFLLNFSKDKFGKKFYLPESVKMNIEFPWELFVIREESCNEVGDTKPGSKSSKTEEEKGFSSTDMNQDYIYLSEKRIMMLDDGIVKLLGKFETLLILSSPVGHSYNKNTYMGKRRRSITDVYGIYDWDMPDTDFESMDQFSLM